MAHFSIAKRHILFLFFKTLQKKRCKEFYRTAHTNKGKVQTLQKVSGTIFNKKMFCESSVQTKTLWETIKSL
jgi:hypothetical protein